MPLPAFAWARCLDSAFRLGLAKDVRPYQKASFGRWKDKAMTKTAYVVLGMHRSGTSSVAGALSHLGAAPPASLMPPKADNPSGFWESERISDFNEEILNSIGTTWLD